MNQLKERVEQRLVETLKSVMHTLSESQRLEVIREWCYHCGGPADCQCWNDE